MANPHDVLGVDRDADEETVEQAYRELVKEHHPDQGGDVEKFHEIRTAYEQITADGTESETETSSSPTTSSSITVSITCSDCGQTKTVAKQNITVIRGKRYCEECYVETSCEQCGEPVVDTKQKFQELGESVICSNCTVEIQCANCHRSVRVNPRKQHTDEVFYCSDCNVAECSRCGKTVTTTNAGQSPVCDDCHGEPAVTLPRSPYTRRAVLGVFAVLTVGGGAKAYQEGYFTGAIGRPEPDLEGTETISISDDSYYAERFTVPDDARVEYELDVDNGRMTSTLYTSSGYEKFKQGLTERNTQVEGNQLDSCSASSLSGSAQVGCHLPGADTYALVLTQSSADSARGVLTYRVFV